jgi:hypothetical protein
MKIIRIGIAAVLLATGAAATAQSATDARCIILSNVFAKQAKDPATQKMAEGAMYFYLGRIGGSATAPQMKTLLDQQANTITDANAGQLMNACVKDVQTKIEMLQSVAKPAAQPQKK